VTPTEFIAAIARMKTTAEYGEDGMTNEDAIATLDNLIEHARTVLDAGQAEIDDAGRQNLGGTW
jgi:hypothetical protein